MGAYPICGRRQGSQLTWVAVAVGVVGAGASIYGANKQASAAKQAASLNMDQFHLINQQQQPYIQSGYGALGKLNTLLGLSPNPNQAQMQPNMGAMPPRMFAGGPGGDPSAWRPTGGGGIQQMIPGGSPQMYGGNPNGGLQGGGLQLKQILALRAAHGDTQAGRILGTMQ